MPYYIERSEKFISFSLRTILIPYLSLASIHLSSLLSIPYIFSLDTPSAGNCTIHFRNN